MADIVIVNPSENMKILAAEIDSCGYKTVFASVSGVPCPRPERVFYFFSGYNVHFSGEPQGFAEKEDGMFLFKNSFLSRLRLGSVTKKLELINPDLEEGNFTDLLAFKRGVLKYPENYGEDVGIYPDLASVCMDFPSSLVISAASAGQSGTKLIRWETDYDLAETFGDDYFVFLSPRGRIEAFTENGKLCTLGKGGAHMEILLSVNKSFAKFSFEKISEEGFLMNRNPWCIEISSPKFLLVNDYSFGSVSISMPSGWYDKLAKYICENRSFSKIFS